MRYKLGIAGIISFCVVMSVASADDKKGAEQGAKAKSQNGAKQTVQTVKIKDLISNPENHLNKRVTIRGEVDDIHGAGLFRVDGEGIINDELLVVRPTETGREIASVTEEDDVEVTGTLRRMTLMEVERGYSMDLDPEIEVELEGSQLYVVADSVRKK